MAVVKVITASVYGPDGNEVLAPGTRVPFSTDLGPEVGWRLDVDPDPEPEPEPEPPPAAPPRKSATVRPEPAAGKGGAHT